MNNSNIFSEKDIHPELKLEDGIHFLETSTNERDEDYILHDISKDKENLEENKIELKQEIDTEYFLIPKNIFYKLEEEMRCGICLNILKEPLELPCFHVFCLDCLRRQVTIQKKSD